jgi:hypothetical protein
MPQYLAELAVDYALEAFLVESAAEAAAVYWGTQAVVYAAVIGYSQNQASIARRRSREAFNSSQVDRLVNVNSTEAPRELVLGRVRKGGQVFFRGSTGTDNAKFILCIALAGHEIDAVEGYYLNDVAVTVDGSGYVQEAPYASESIESFAVPYIAGDTSVTLPFSPIAGSVYAVSPDLGGDASPLPTPVLTVVGLVVTFDAPAPFPGAVNFQYSVSFHSAKLRSYLGAPGQTADATLISLFPGLWTSNHIASGIPYVIGEFDYNENSFPSGLPTITVKLRGAKIYNPATTLTEWTENPALMQRHVLLHPQFGKRTSITAEEDARIIQVAAECATSTAWIVNGASVTAPLYRAALVSPYGTAARDLLDDLATAMGGRWSHAQGQFFTRAGVFHASIKTITEADLATVTRNPDGQENSSGISISTHKERASKFNTAQIRIWDQAQSFKEVPLTPLKPSALVARDGIEIVQEFRMAAVPYAYQALHIAGLTMRDARDPLTLTIVCKLSVYHIELFDTVAVTLSRFGWSSKLFEVVGRKWLGQGTIQLVLKETAASNYDPDTNFIPGGFADNTALTTPFAVSPPGTLTAVSGTGELEKLRDGTVLARVLVSWPTITNKAVLEGGWIDIAYLPDNSNSWIYQTAPGDSTEVYLRGVQDSSVMLIKARCRTTLATSNWGVQIAHTVVGKTAPPSDVVGLAGTVSTNRITWTWTVCTDVDYGVTEARVGGTNWATATTPPAFSGTANTYTQTVNAVGTYTLRVRHIDTSGNLSSGTASVSISIEEKDILVGGGNLLLCGSMALPAISGNAGGWATTPDWTPTLIASGAAIGNGPYQRLTRAASGSPTYGFLTASTTGYVGGGMRAPGAALPCDLIISFYARASSGFSSTPTASTYATPTISTDLLRPTISTSWQRYAIRKHYPSSTIPEYGGVYLYASCLVAGEYIEISNVQVEYGYVLTNYSETLYGPADTAQLLPNSATTRVSAFDTASALTSTLADCLTATIVSKGGQITIWTGGGVWASGSLAGGSGGVLLHVELWRDSTLLIATQTDPAAMGTGGFSSAVVPIVLGPYSETPAAGTYVYKLRAKWIANGGSPFSVTAYLQDKALVIVEHKV